MKRHNKITGIIAALIAAGCTDVAEPEITDKITDSNDTEPFIITVGLPGGETDTRLDFAEVDFEGRKAVRTYWEDGDIIVANATPGNYNYVYSFHLTEGEGTSTGTFECNIAINGSTPPYLSSSSWTIYFPGTNIRAEEDFLTHSYAGQIQKGNGNMDHLKDFHTLRMTCTDSGVYSVFDESFIELSGENLEESSCLKFNLTGLPGIVPNEITVSYSAPSGHSSSCFSTHNRLDRWWICPVASDNTTSSKMTLGLEDFGTCSDIEAYMAMSNYPVYLHNGGKLKVTVTSEQGVRYNCIKSMTRDVTLQGGRFHTITCKEWEKETISNFDGFDHPEDGIIVLQEASAGSGADIVIMGDGFAEDKFEDGTYAEIMTKAYDDFFSVEPYRSLKDYFNVYYINAVSKDNHDAEPYFNEYGAQNGAINGSAETVFNTQFSPGTTSITGDDSKALEYAMQAIRTKGGKNGTACTDENEVTYRANRALMIVMVNVQCHAGTCSLVWTTGSDYGNAYSVAYTALGNNSEEQRRWTTIHEAGGHGFGKLGDEYGGLKITGFNTGAWHDLDIYHQLGIHRNINEYWGPEERADGWSLSWEDTTEDNVYWSELLGGYDYEESEGLGVYRGGYTYENFFCRPTPNSVMRSQFSNDGKFFNAISRWAIWYRLMKLTGCTNASDFKSSLNEFIAFDSTISIETEPLTRSAVYDNGMLPLAPPVMIQAEWIDGGTSLRTIR